MAYIARNDRPEDKSARYAEVAEEIMAVLEGEPNRTARMATVASMLHDAFETFFWTGFYVVDEDKRAWHAGVASWKGQQDLHSRSIGIEIVNGGHDFPLPDGSLPPYPRPQIHALLDLVHDILGRHDIPATRILGHSDIAPLRKQDPGEHFPWERLARAGISLWPEFDGTTKEIIGKGLERGTSGSSVWRLQTMLSEIGYGFDVTDIYGETCEKVITAFQRRWLPEHVTGQADLNTLRRIGVIHALFTA